VVLQLIEEGKLALDTTLDRFAPYVPLADYWVSFCQFNYLNCLVFRPVYGINTYPERTLEQVITHGNEERQT
jgi:hypothetical protein